MQVIIIFTPRFHIVVGVLIEATEGVAVVQLVVEAEAALKEWIARMPFLSVGNYPQRIGKDGLLKLTAIPLIVISSEKVGEQF